MCLGIMLFIFSDKLLRSRIQKTACVHSLLKHFEMFSLLRSNKGETTVRREKDVVIGWVFGLDSMTSEQRRILHAICSCMLAIT